MDEAERTTASEDASTGYVEDGLSITSLGRRLAVGLVGLMAAVGVLGWALYEPLEALSSTFVQQFGLAGVFGGVLFTDTFVLTHEPVLLVAHAGGLDFWPIFFTASAASVTAGVCGWSLGMLFGRLPFVQRMFERYRINAFLRRYGMWAIAVAALTPFPYSVATWASGAAGVNLKTLLIGSLFRVPKVMFYFLLIVGSWSLGGAM